MLAPLFIDTFLLDYHLGHVILFGFALSLLAAVPLKSQKVIASVFAGLGTIFLAGPYTTMPKTYILIGIPMVLIGSLLWTMAGS